MPLQLFNVPNPPKRLPSKRSLQKATDDDVCLFVVTPPLPRDGGTA